MRHTVMTLGRKFEHALLLRVVAAVELPYPVKAFRRFTEPVVQYWCTFFSAVGQVGLVLDEARW